MGRDADYLAFVRRATASVRDDAPPPTAASVPKATVASVTDYEVPVAARPGGDAMRARLYRPASRLAHVGLVYVHGGGWAHGDVESWDPVVRNLVAASGVSMLSIAQRQAPAHPYPAALDDTVAAVRWLRTHAADLALEASEVGVAGDSSGGNVAAAAALRLRDEGEQPLSLQLLVYPVVDLVHAPVDLPDPDGIDWHRGDPLTISGAYVGTADRAHRYLSPALCTDLRGLPPTVVVTAEYDRLRPEAERYAALLSDAGVPVELVPGPGLDHAFVAWVAFARRPREVVEDIGRAVRRLLS